MTVKISYLNRKINELSSNLVLFTNERFDIKSLKKNLSSSEFSYIDDLLKTSDLKNKILVFVVNSKKKLFSFQLKII